jgi:hypothetical protein
VGNAGPGRQIELGDQQKQRDSERHPAPSRQDAGAPDRDCEEHSTYTEQNESECKGGSCRGAEPDGIDQLKQVERCAGIQLASDGVQRESSAP